LSLKCAVLAFLVVSLVLIPTAYKKPIEKATYAELIQIPGIGEHRAELIMESGITDVDDLIIIDGIGVKLVHVLKERYR
jgi:DNA uptake protein ComE-like DNA-binding protein